MTSVAGPFTAVHQVLPSLHVADASGDHTLRARDALRRAGFSSDVFVDQVDPALAAEARPFGELDAAVVAGRTALLYQLSVGSVLVDRLLGRPEPLLVNYHNLTPASFFWEWAPQWLDAVALGRRQLHQLADRTCHAIADSEFNRRDLVAAGYRSTVVVPPIVAAGPIGQPGHPRATGTGPRRASGTGPGADPQVAAGLDAEAEPERAGRPAPAAGRGARWLFVGSLLPHKGAHRVVQALAAYRSAFDPAARLALVGGTPIDGYRHAVESYAADLGLGDAVTVTGKVGDAELQRHYAEADVFVCLSAHEGFCFPLVEAMARDLPVVAFDAGAVAGTAGDAAVVLRRANPVTVAAAVHRVLSDEHLRSTLVRRGRRRLAVFDPVRTSEALVAEVRRALGAWPGSPSAPGGGGPDQP